MANRKKKLCHFKAVGLSKPNEIHVIHMCIVLTMRVDKKKLMSLLLSFSYNCHLSLVFYYKLQHLRSQPTSDFKSQYIFHGKLTFNQHYM